MGAVGGGDGFAKELGVVEVGGSQLFHRSIIGNCKAAPSACAWLLYTVHILVTI